MTPDEFFGKYDQKFVDFDGNKKYWCVDLYRQFVKEVFNFPQSPLVPSAKDIWINYLTDYFDRIDNTPINCPIKGDIIIWGTGAGADGHVAICKDGDKMQFTSFDQNWPLLSPCHFQPHNYNNVLGWLRVKKVEDTTPPPPATPDLSGEVTALSKQVEQLMNDNTILLADNDTLGAKLDRIYDVIYGRGWVWIRMNKLKELLPK